MRIVFMGTPDFAVPCLQALLDAGHEVVGVFTQPDKPKGRSQTLSQPPVKELAVAKGIPVFQPTKMRDGTAEAVLRDLAPQLVVVAAYGRILPKALLEIPPFGCINVHGSLLPKYRGAAPIQWAVINGDQEAGVTIMQMDEGMDTGAMLLKGALPVGEDETAGELFERLSSLGAKTLLEAIPLLEAGALTPVGQEEEKATYSPMLTKALGEMDFTQSAATLHNLVRGTNPWPGAYTTLEGKTLKVHRSRPIEGMSGRPGELLSEECFLVACGEGALELLEVQLEGKGRMEGMVFLRGKRLKVGKIITDHS